MKGGLQINSPKKMVQVSLDRVDDARATYTEATKLCKDSIPLWLLLADLEVIVKIISRAVNPCGLRNL